MPGRGRRHGRRHQRPDAGAAVQPREAARPAIERTAVILDIFAERPPSKGGPRSSWPAVPPAGCAGAGQLSAAGVVGSAPARAPVRRSWRLIVAASPVGSLASSTTWPTSSATGSSRRSRGVACQRDHRGLHERRQVDVAEPADGRRCPGRDRLFATLDPTTRLALPGGEPVLVTDTVGFVRPARPRRGLQEHWKVVAEADLLVHVVDASSADPGRRSTPCTRCSARSRPATSPNCSCSTRPTSLPRRRDGR